MPVLYEFRETLSTNNLARESGQKGGEEGQVFLAFTQTAGRGRVGKSWDSPFGGLYMSILLRPTRPREEWPTLTQVAAISVLKVCAPLLSSDNKMLFIKLPNDVVVPRAAFARTYGISDTSVTGDTPYYKLCGVNAEAHGDFVVTGIGINVLKSPVPHEINGVYQGISLEELGWPVAVTAGESLRRDGLREPAEEAVRYLCAQVTREFECRYARWQASGPDSLDELPVLSTFRGIE